MVRKWKELGLAGLADICHAVLQILSKWHDIIVVKNFTYAGPFFEKNLSNGYSPANLANLSTRAKLAVFRNMRDSPDSPTFAKPCCADSPDLLTFAKSCCVDSPDSQTFAKPCCADSPDSRKASLVSFTRI
jgi:hypothetical protein